MRKYIIKTTFILATLLGGGFFVSSCEDIDDIQELSLDRILSPTDLSVRIRNSVNAEITWGAMEHADSYTLEVYQGTSEEGTLVRTVEGITNPSYTVSGLLGDTSYFIRVKAVGTGINDSRWVTIAITTDPEQIFSRIETGDLLATSVTLRWNDNGTSVTRIAVTPGDINYTLTAQDISNGYATIEGLTGQTEYTAVIYDGNTPRGSLTFTTPRDLGGATLVTTAEELVQALADAESGDVLALDPGEYEVSALTVNKDITLMGTDATNKPVLKSTVFEMSNNAGLSLINLIIDGDNQAGRAINYVASGSFNAVAISGCDFKNYTTNWFYISGNAAAVESITVTNCYFENVSQQGGEFLDIRSGAVKEITFSNNTLKNCAPERGFFRIDNSSTAIPEITSSIIRIENNTLYKVSNTSGSNGRLLYIRYSGNQIYFNNNIVANTAGRYTNSSSTNIVEMKDNNYFEAPAARGDNKDTGAFYEFNPQFADPENGDFTVGNADVKDYNIGDTRWL